ncbi:ribosylnicotinamide kinase [Cytospora paraplurivora]|uniref:Ribosylnicotinamide kinase n=1 Tax=Cytospora paraplurivora TaxID=2898453 RepID=A0AAN9UFB4_9PEZI
MGDQKAVVVGLSGCSSSGKTTLARLLRDIFPNTFILHEDDFYRPEEESVFAEMRWLEIPLADTPPRLPFKGGVRDWDCAESINIPDLEKALSYIRAEGAFPVSTTSSGPTETHRSNHDNVISRWTTPAYKALSSPPLPGIQPFVDSKEDKNSVGKCPASPAKIEAMKAKVQAWLRPGSPGHDIFPAAAGGDGDSDADGPPRVCLLDGFLLYSPPRFSRVMDLIDIRLFLQVTHAKATQRREARDGYVTLEGFWKDPPGYVDDVVWPNYVEAHRWMFVGGDVEGGRLDWDALRQRGVLAQHLKAEGDAAVGFEFEDTLEWAVDSVMAALEGWNAQRKR